MEHKQNVVNVWPCISPTPCRHLSLSVLNISHPNSEKELLLQIASGDEDALETLQQKKKI
ncbi:hypothetical protein QEG73_10705 [Chitinophagaceae bacterium 26-R-25]|nr:hypothetical protein [Chitinophagaceae bacterium 26-R-25]